MVNCTWDNFFRDSVAHLVITDIGLSPCHLWHWATLSSWIFASFIRSKKFCRTRRRCFGMVRCCVEHCIDSCGLSIRRHPNVVQSAADLCFIGPHLAHASPAIDKRNTISRRLSGRACRGHSTPQSRYFHRTHTCSNSNKALSISRMGFIGVWINSRLSHC